MSEKHFSFRRCKNIEKLFFVTEFMIESKTEVSSLQWHPTTWFFSSFYYIRELWMTPWFIIQPSLMSFNKKKNSKKTDIAGSLELKKRITRPFSLDITSIRTSISWHSIIRENFRKYLNALYVDLTRSFNLSPSWSPQISEVNRNENGRNFSSIFRLLKAETFWSLWRLLQFQEMILFIISA